MTKIKNKLDERQEQKLLQIEHNGCWFAFWALLVAMLVQQAIFGFSNLKYVAGEWLVFMCLALYLAISCIKNGIWDRKLNPSPKANLLVSLVAALIAAVVIAVVNYFNFGSVEAAFWTFVILLVLLFVLIFVALSLSSALYKNRVRKLEADFEQDADEE